MSFLPFFSLLPQFLNGNTFSYQNNIFKILLTGIPEILMNQSKLLKLQILDLKPSHTTLSI